MVENRGILLNAKISLSCWFFREKLVIKGGLVVQFSLCVALTESFKHILGHSS